MNLTCNSQSLAKELRLFSKIAPSKPPLPILSHVLLRAEDTLRLSATDLEIGLRTTCTAQIEMPGVVALPVAKLLQMVEQFHDTDVSISLDKTHVLIKCGAFKSRLQAMQADDFPTLPEPEGISSTIDAKDFRQMIDRTRYAIVESGGKYLLQGALLTLSGPVAAMIATDGKRLSLATMSRTGADARFVIPAKTLDVLSSSADIGEIELTVGERHLFFAAGGRLLISRTLDGEFPKYERIIPRDNNKIVTVERGVLTAALKRVGLVSEENRAVYLQLTGQSMELSSSSAEVGSADEQIAVGYTGPDLKICVNGTYLLDFLDAAAGQTVTIALKDANSAALLTDGENHLAVVMLMKG